MITVQQTNSKEQMKKLLKYVEINWFSLTFITAYLVLIFYFITEYQYAFNYKALFNESYKLSFFCSLFLCLYIVKVLVKKKVSYYLFISTFILTGLLFYSYDYPNREYLSIVLCLCICFFSYAIIGLRYFKFVFYIFFLLFAYNLIICIYSAINEGAIRGIINNSGILAIYMAINIPVLFFFAIHLIYKTHFLQVFKRIDLLFLLFLISIIITVFTIILKSESRTAILTMLILIVLYVKKFNILILKNRFFSTTVWVTCGLAITIVLLNHIINLSSTKESSVKGRFIMYKIASSHLLDNFWLGTGLGRFSWFYPQWQAEYFKSHSDYLSKSLLRSSGECYIILNEYLQILLSVGLIGTVMPGFFFFLL